MGEGNVIHRMFCGDWHWANGKMYGSLLKIRRVEHLRQKLRGKFLRQQTVDEGNMNAHDENW